MAVHHTHARHLRLTPPPPATVSTVIYHPSSLSLALQHPDTSFSLYSNITPTLPPPSPQTTVTTTVSPPSSAALFLTLKTTATSSSTLFIVTSPYNNSILLRFYMMKSDGNSKKFVRVRVRVKHRDMCYDERKVGVLFKVNHGVNVKVVAGVSNVFVMYSVACKKVWVFGVKMCEGGEEVKVVRTAVIDCDLPVFSVGVSGGELVLGEENGVRVFNLRSLVKGRVEKGGKKVNLVNGSAVSYGKYGKVSGGRRLVSVVNGSVDEKIAKLKPVKMRQNSKDGGVRFVAFKCNELEDQNSSKVPSTSIKAISVHFLANNEFLILDSFGDVYLLSLSNPVSGSDSTCEMKKLTLSMKVQNLAVLPDDSSRPQIVWLSDGQYTIHAMILSDTDSPTNENETKDIEEKIQNAATEVIFTSEKIQEIIPLAANAILLLGQEFPGLISSIMICSTYEVSGLVLLFKKWIPCVLFKSTLSHCYIFLLIKSFSCFIYFHSAYPSVNTELLKRILWNLYGELLFEFYRGQERVSQTVHAKTYASNMLPTEHSEDILVTNCMELVLLELKSTMEV